MNITKYAFLALGLISASIAEGSTVYVEIDDSCPEQLKLIGASLDGKTWDRPAGSPDIDLVPGNIIRLSVQENAGEHIVEFNMSTLRAPLGAGFAMQSNDRLSTRTRTSIQTGWNGDLLFFKLSNLGLGIFDLHQSTPLSSEQMDAAIELDIVQ